MEDKAVDKKQFFVLKELSRTGRIMLREMAGHFRFSALPLAVQSLIKLVKLLSHLQKQSFCKLKNTSYRKICNSFLQTDS